jgi:hypothetical protein
MLDVFIVPYYMDSPSRKNLLWTNTLAYCGTASATFDKIDRSALEYLVPLLQWEKNQTKRASLKEKVDRYIAR